MVQTSISCPICKLTGCKAQADYHTDSDFVNCKRCGCFVITDTASECDYGHSEEDMYLFSGYLRNNSSKKNPITVKSTMLEQLKEIIAPLKRMTVIDKLNLIINYVGDTTTIGQEKKVDLDCDFTVFYFRNQAELLELLQYAKEQGLLEFNLSFAPLYMDETKGKEPYTADLKLTFHGWQRFDENQRINVNSKNAFIAMSFDEDLDDVFCKAILGACEECGFKAIRVDKSEHNEKICDKIIAEIKQSRFLIAEFTQQKHGVYFEAGFAYGLGLPVIWCCHKNDVEKLHFDTRQYNHVIWENVEDFKNKLVNRIKATI